MPSSTEGEEGSFCRIFKQFVEVRMSDCSQCYVLNSLQHVENRITQAAYLSGRVVEERPSHCIIYIH